MSKTKAPKKEAGSTRKTYVVSGSVSSVEVKQANTSQGPKPYAVARIETAAAEGKKSRTIPVLTFYPTGIKALQGKKDGAKVKVFGTFESFKGRDGKKKQTFAVIGNHTPKLKQEKNVEVNL
jgi:hypothetical protein